jgi:hypothetical protein
MNTRTKLTMAALIWAVPAHAETVNGLRTADEFGSIADQTARSSALFEEMFVVIENPRSLNCHPVGDVPLQGNMMTPHQPPVVRGMGDLGARGACAALPATAQKTSPSPPEKARFQVTAHDSRPRSK